MEAANEAFQATAGRFRKIYAVEKLTGNCLQKIIFEQAEQSQATEDGFQKIREVTGLTDVMDIVHKFLNRDVEHGQLRASVREAEVRLMSLREAEVNRHGEDAAHDQDASEHPRKGFNTEAVEMEQALQRALRDREEQQAKLRESTLLIDNIMQWSRRMNKSFAPFEELDDVDCPADILPYFASLAQTVDRFLAHAQEEMPMTKLSKITSQACTKEYQEQQRLLDDKDFIRANCRVPASLDNRPVIVAGGRQSMLRSSTTGAPMGDEERQEHEVASERERLKQESHCHVTEKKDPDQIRSVVKSREGRRDRQRGSDAVLSRQPPDRKEVVSPACGEPAGARYSQSQVTCRSANTAAAWASGPKSSESPSPRP